MPGFVLPIERTAARLRRRYESPVVPERFRGPAAMEDRPLYAWARRLLKSAKGMKGREVRERSMERPPGIEGRLEERVPQFFLRNIARVERAVDDSLPFEEVRTRDPAAERVGGRALAGRYERPRLIEHWNLDDVLWLRAVIRRYVYEEDWRTRFGRELKEHVRGPLFRYSPDAPAEGGGR